MILNIFKFIFILTVTLFSSSAWSANSGSATDTLSKESSEIILQTLSANTEQASPSKGLYNNLKTIAQVSSETSVPDTFQKDAPLANDSVNLDEPMGQFTPPSPHEVESFQPFITYDLGGSTGTFNGFSYVETQLGLNWFLKKWLIWRNSLFYRQSQDSRFFGLDSNIRFQAQVGDGQMAFRVFGGPGVRITTQGQALPLIEAGGVIRLGGLQIGGGARAILHPLVSDNETSDVSFFLILGGGGRI